jgi:hypothetical protein
MTTFIDDFIPHEVEAIILDCTICKGITLDKMTCVGPRGGTKVYWRAASKRGAWIGHWHPTQRQAAKHADYIETVVRL